jgi:hypothetical protein
LKDLRGYERVFEGVRREYTVEDRKEWRGLEGAEGLKNRGLEGGSKKDL